MKAKEFGQFIETFITLLNDVGADESTKAWEQTLPLFAQNPEATVVQLTKAISKTSPTSEVTGIQAAKLISMIPSLISFLQKPAKKAYITDCEKLKTALLPFENIAISEIVQSTLNDLKFEEQKKLQKELEKQQKQQKEAALINHYVSKLESSLGNAEMFPAIVEEIKEKNKGGKNAELSVAAIKKIAHEFTRALMSELNSKAKALAAINYRHETLMIGRAKSQATGDRTAA